MAYQHIGADEPPHIEMPAFDVAAARAERTAIKGTYRGSLLAAQLAKHSSTASSSGASASRKLPGWALPVAIGVAAVFILRRSR